MFQYLQADGRSRAIKGDDFKIAAMLQTPLPRGWKGDSIYLGCTGKSITGFTYTYVEAQFPDVQVTHRVLGRIALGLGACHRFPGVL